MRGSHHIAANQQLDWKLMVGSATSAARRCCGQRGATSGDRPAGTLISSLIPGFSSDPKPGSLEALKAGAQKEGRGTGGASVTRNSGIVSPNGHCFPLQFSAIVNAQFSLHSVGRRPEMEGTGEPFALGGCEW